MASFKWPSTVASSSFSSITLNGATSGSLTLTVPAVVSTYTIIFPAAQGTGALVNDGSGNLSWSASGGITFGNLTDAGTDGIVITGGTGAVKGSGTSIAQHVADSTHNGYLSSTDWSTFNSKQAALTIGNLTDAGTDGITVTAGTGAVIGSGTSIAQRVADTTHNGYLSSTDWNTFNGKQATGNYATSGSGDVSWSAPSGAGPVTTTIGANKVANSQLAQMATLTIKGNNTGGTANALDLTVAQVNTMLGSFVNPMTTLGDLIIGDTGGNPVRLAPNTTTTKKFLTQTGNGGTSNAQAYSTIVAADVPSLAASIITSGTLATARGGTNSDSSASTGIAHVSSGTWSYAAVDLSGADATGILAAARFPVLTGDVTTSSGSLATTLAATTNGTIAALTKSTGVAIHGTNTNDSASAGNVGEYVESIVSTATSVVAASTAYEDGTSISLTAGDWEVTYCEDWVSQSSATGLAEILTGISTTTGNSSTGLVRGSNLFAQDYVTPLGNGFATFIMVPCYRMSFASTTTVYGKHAPTYTGTAPKFRCRLSARRLR